MFTPHNLAAGLDAMSIPPTRADATSLADLPPGRHARIVRIRGDRGLMQRLMGLGLSTGSEVEILHRRGKGVVIGLNGNRIALGAGIAAQIDAHPLDPVDSEEW